MALFHYLWSRTAGSNATADAAVNWAEGQAPSSVNDSARAMMASAAGFRDDISGATVTGGTSTNYTLSTYQVFDTLAHMNGQMIAFSPHTTSGAGGVNINVDGLGLKPLYIGPLGTLPNGVLVQGTPYVATYNSADAAFYMHGFYNNPYQLPIGGSIDYWGTAAPNSNFALMYGQAISRTTYATLFALFSTTFGTGDGSTTFNIPDLRGRVVAGDGDMGGSDAARLTATYFGSAGTTLGAVGGAESHTLVAANLPPYTPAGSISGGVSSVFQNITSPAVGATHMVVASASGDGSTGAGNTLSATFTGTAAAGQISTPVATVQPTIIGNKILRLI